MSTDFIQDRIEHFTKIMLDLGMAEPSVIYALRSGLDPQITVRWRKEDSTWDNHYKYFTTMLEVNKFLVEMPDKKARELDAFRLRVANLIDDSKNFDIPIDYSFVLTQLMEKLSSNALTGVTITSDDDIPF